MDRQADGARRRGEPDETWERARAEGVARMVATEHGVVWADGHTLFTLGAHTSHTVRPIAFCEDAAWASAIARAIDALTATPSTPAPADNDAHAPGKSVGGEIE